MNIPRAEHPNPQWQRKNWECLNGKWKFDFDYGRSAIERKLYENTNLLTKEITVPFCPESKLSGVGYTDFIPAVVYSKEINISKEQLDGRVFLHFGAVDYSTVVYVNGTEVCKHNGGYTPFEADITKALSEGENTIFVYAEDDTKSTKQCSGKQSTNYESYGCLYTRTTGIWQSVWLEFVPKNYIFGAKYYTDPVAGTLTVFGKTNGNGNVKIKALYEGKEVGCSEGYSCGNFIITVKLSQIYLWEPGHGRLYDLELSMDGDVVYSYFGLRNISLEQKAFKINGKAFFQKLVLDQGYYPDGLYTAPSESDIINDIEIAQGLGFNGARLHQKVFEPRFLYHCDRLGYVVWGEYPTWGFDCAEEMALSIFIHEWAEVINRDFNHPSIVCWCPFNETWNYVEYLHHNKFLSTVYRFTKEIDMTRPCIDTSGNYHTVTDIFDVHDYEQDPEKFASFYSEIDKKVLNDQINRRYGNGLYQVFKGEPVIVSEYGGIQWSADEKGWGYGKAPKTEEEFIDRYKKLTHCLIDNEYVLGFCYTQLYDIEQEQNGLYTYDRKPKFNPAVIKEINDYEKSDAEIVKKA